MHKKGSQPQKPQLNPADIKEFVCTKCEGNLFDIVYKIGKVSTLAGSNPTGNNIFLVQNMYQCNNKKCGYLVKEVLPGGP